MQWEKLRTTNGHASANIRDARNGVETILEDMGYDVTNKLTTFKKQSGTRREKMLYK